MKILKSILLALAFVAYLAVAEMIFTAVLAVGANWLLSFSLWPKILYVGGFLATIAFGISVIFMVGNKILDKIPFQNIFTKVLLGIYLVLSLNMIFMAVYTQYFSLVELPSTIFVGITVIMLWSKIRDNELYGLLFE